MIECAPVIMVSFALPCCSKIEKRSARIDRTCFHKTQRVVPPVLDVKGPLAPGSYPDLATRLAMHILLRQAAHGLGPLKHRVEVAYDKIESLSRGVRLANG